MIQREALDPDAYRLMRAGRWSEALPFAERAIADARTCEPGHGMLATILLQLGRKQECEAVVTRAMAFDSGTGEAYDGLAYVSMLLDRHARANSLYRRAVDASPTVPRHWYNLACSERSLGRLAEAEVACDRCIALDPGQYPTHLLRSELRVQTREANHVEELLACLGRVGTGSGSDASRRAYLGYALAKELDDLHRFDEAFQWFAEAAKARRSMITYDVAGDERKLRRIAEVFSSPTLAVDGAQADPSGDGGARCIFIVGLPRSGTTLVERILSGLDGVRSNGETENFSRALTSAAPRGTGDMFERAAAADPAAVATRYGRLARLGDCQRAVIEKLPTNYLYLGAIRRALPNARIVWVARAPLDSCFAMFRTLFGDAFPFTYDFDELARYYAAYAALMKHWRNTLGGSIFEVVYEDLVGEPSVVGERLARYCGLRWDDRALHIEGNRSVSLTASAAQVRRPIYGTSSGRWRHYRRHLAPLIDAQRRRGVPLPLDA